VRILPYNRVLKDLNGLTPAALLERLATVCQIGPATAPNPADRWR